MSKHFGVEKNNNKENRNINVNTRDYLTMEPYFVGQILQYPLPKICYSLNNLLQINKNHT